MDKLQELTKEELITIIGHLLTRIAELEERLNQNSSNSSKPPSSDCLRKPKVKSLREKSGRKPGGQKGHTGHGLKISKEPDEEIAVCPVSCSECGEGLLSEPLFHSDTKYVYDVQIEMKLIRYDIQEAVCPTCGTTVKAMPPKECRGSVNYGNMLRTLCVVLTQYANVSIDKTHKILRDLLGVPISSGTVKSVMSQFASLTGATIGEITSNLLKSSAINGDETGCRVAGRTQWIHVQSNGKYTLLTVHKKRGKDGSRASGVLDEYAETLVHDCWAPYFGFDKCKHALCCAHLLRELNALIEQGQKWASDMKSLLLEMKKVVENYKDNDKTELSRYYREKFKTLYDNVLDKAKSEITPSITRKKSKAENLLIRLEEYRAEITRFTNDFDVPFDNNQAERDIRNVKVKQKVSGCFRTEKGAEDYTNTSSVIGTAVKFGQSVVNVVKHLFAGDMPCFSSTTE
jgi:transposase